MILTYPATCSCGADCPKGTNVRMEMLASGIRWTVAACPACDVSLSRRADVGVDRLEPGISMAERMRRNREKQARKRAKENKP